MPGFFFAVNKKTNAMTTETITKETAQATQPALQAFLKEMEREAITTRRMLERVPDDKHDWKPHEKSMTLGRLATHIAELPGWAKMTLATEELDFAKSEYKPEQVSNTAELLAYFERTLGEGRRALLEGKDEELKKAWTLRNGAQIYDVSPKADVIRMSFCQIVHHRAQLGVYLRLLNIPLPGSYGPSADEGFM